ncbi:MAG: T9SS type A sorting domain-containing protein [Sphingobacteriales bacterium]|nr:MAG: T9SS type A sorting domain-containing protein [Sphingobacteriales bacterium]
MKQIFSFLFVLMLVCQLSFAGVVDVRFTDATLNDNTYCVTVQVKAQDIGFEIGSATVFFSYNTAALSNPTATPLRFSETDLCAVGGSTSFYRNSFNYLETGPVGEGNYAILLLAANQGCPTINNTEWVDVAQYCFDVVNASIPVNLEFNTVYTAFNTVDNSGDQHTLGDLSSVLFSVSTPSVNAPAAGIVIYPNYTQNKVVVEYSLVKQDNVKISIYDMLGRAVYASQKNNVAAGKHTLDVDLSKYGNGYYLVEIDNGTEKVTEKILLVK